MCKKGDVGIMTVMAKTKPDAYVVSSSEREKLLKDTTSREVAQSISCAAKEFESLCIKSTNITFLKK